MDRAMHQRQIGDSGFAVAPDRSWPRWEEPLSTIQNTRRADLYGDCSITCSTNRSKGAIPLLRFTTTKDFGLMHIPSRQIGPRSPALVFMLHFHGVMGTGLVRSRGCAAPGLDAGLFIGREHKFILAQRLILPDSLIKVQEAAGFGGKIRIARKNPTAVLPRPNGVLVQPAPDGRYH